MLHLCLNIKFLNLMSQKLNWNSQVNKLIRILKIYQFLHF